MDFLRRHFFLILCGVGAVVGIALMVTGLRAMPDVVSQLEEVGGLYEKLGSLKPANQQILDAQQRRIDQVLADRNAVLGKVKEQSKYEPLVPEAFPDGNAEACRQFRKVYYEEMKKLFESLRSGRPATDPEIAAMKEKIEEEALRRIKMGAEPTPADEIGPDSTPSGVVTKAGARKDPAVRAHLAAAQRIYCYAVETKETKEAKTQEGEPGLMLDAGMRETPEAPDLSTVWRAQLSYWVQKDVVDAIAAINDEAAAAARERGEDRWVGMMPVKEVISIRTSKGYVMPSDDQFAGSKPGGYGVAVPPAAMKTAFTQSASSEFFEVMQFSVKLIMDQREILKFVEKLCNHTLHTPLRIAYVAVEPNRSLKGKIYGSGPVVNVVMDFETTMPGAIFRPLMPAKACEDFGIPCGGAVAAAAGGDKSEKGD